MRLHLGCANKRKNGWINIDIRQTSVTDVVAPIQQLPYDDQSVDAIYCRHTLEHLAPQDAAAAVVEWARVLRDGGQLQVIVPNLVYHARQIIRGRDRDLRRALNSIYGHRDPSRGGDVEDAHRWGYVRSSLQQLLEERGFIDVRAADSGSDLHPKHLNLLAVRKV